MPTYMTNDEVKNLYKERVENNKTFDDWVRYFMENGATYKLACSLAKSKYEFPYIPAGGINL